jgi:three-Cys-motif partner protein
VPSFKPKAIWAAAPHTLAKIEIVQRYLYLWFSIMGRSNATLVYIDGFAGPGRYTNSEQSSPMAALKAALAALDDSGSALRTKHFAFRFIEKDLPNELREVVFGTSWPAAFDIKVEGQAFEKYMTLALQKVRDSGKPPPPTFAFIDPFGATGVPFGVISELLSYPRCEVLINLDSDGIGRLVTAQQFQKNQQHLNSIFGNDTWKTALDPSLPMPRLSAQVLAFYKERLLSLPKTRYVFPFAMNTKQGQLNYHLVFASQHPLGLRKMKDAMRAVDQTGTYTFSDDTVGQSLFTFDSEAPAVFALQMQRKLGGKWRPYSEFDDFALNETPFTDPKGMLRVLDSREKVHLKCIGSPPRKGTFPELRIQSILVEQ